MFSHILGKTLFWSFMTNLLSSQQLPENAKERILSEDYVSLIYHNETFPFDIDQILPEYLPQMVDWQYAVLNAPLQYFPPNIITQGYFTIPKLYTLLNEASLEASGIPQVQNQPFLNLTGKGVLLGFLDTGIDYRHPAFRNSDGTSRILRIWDQTIQSGVPPEGFLYGSEYTKEQIDAALQTADPLKLVPTTDENGHGTAVAGIAAGTPDPALAFSGAAPEAGILAVKLKPAKNYLRNYFLVSQDAPAFQEDDCMLALRYLNLTAQKLDLPLVICFSLGTNQGGHDGYTPLDEVLTSLSYAAGTYAVAAGGNEGNEAHHYYGTMQRQGETQEVQVSVTRENPGFTMEFWAQAPELYSLGVISPQGERLLPILPRIGATQNASFLLDHSKVQIDYEVIEFRSGSQMIQVRIENPSAGIWRFPIVNHRFLNGQYHLWLPITGLASPYVKMLSPEPNTTLTAPANSMAVITCSTYQVPGGSFYLGSSRGFTRSGQIKPDLAAPGVEIQAPRILSGYQSFTGSSAAAAITAGAVAMLVQWGRRTYRGKLFTYTEIKNLLYRGAVQSDDLYYPNQEWGYGTLNVYGIFQALTDF